MNKRVSHCEPTHTLPTARDVCNLKPPAHARTIGREAPNELGASRCRCPATTICRLRGSTIPTSPPTQTSELSRPRTQPEPEPDVWRLASSWEHGDRRHIVAQPPSASHCNQPHAPTRQQGTWPRSPRQRTLGRLGCLARALLQYHSLVA